ncbi:TonB-dependent receptor (plasmid) [Sphingobium sp. SJ10-10]|uniref:TonB-dependent receptor n=1 Tax=Sphingobium sp. SJ10-10 TaxID=3114999 RepID=UPI002E178167|nr:TonB-dependent receptor [Sphingobium sp. SJ10-10]
MITEKGVEEMTIRSLGIMLGSTLIYPTIAYAQGTQHSQTSLAADAREVSNDEIIVTAQKREQVMSRVPVTMNVATNKEITALGITKTDDLAKIAPGFTAARVSQSGSVVYTLRGVGLNESTLGALPSVSVYVDEAPLPFGFMAQSTALDLERIEVLKGPQGLLFGQNSAAGAINFIAKKPTRQVEAGIRASAGRFNTFDSEAYISGPLSSTLSGRIAVNGVHGGDWQQSYTRDDEIGKSRRAAGRMQLLWEPSPRLRALANVNGWLDKSDPQIPQYAGPNLLAPPFALPGVANYPLPAKPTNRDADWSILPAPAGTSPLGGTKWGNDNYFWGAGLRIDWDVFSDVTLTSLTNVGRARLDSITDIDGAVFDTQHYRLTGNLRTTDQEVRLTSKIGRFDLTAGGSFEYARAREQNYGWIPDQSSVVAFNFLPTPTRNVAYSANQTHKTWGIFGSIDTYLTDELSLIGGVRYSDVRHKLLGACIADGGDGGFAAVGSFLSGTARSVAGLPPMPNLFAPGGCVTLGPDFLPYRAKDSFSEDNVSWKFGINWRESSQVFMYASVSRGYKSGSYINTAGLSYKTYLTPVRQEENTAYEAGVKLSMINRSVLVNASVFYYDLTDKQILGTLVDPFFGTLPVLANIPKSRVVGFDADITLLPVHGLTIRGGINHSDSKVRSHMILPRYDSVPEDIYGFPFPFAPKWSLTGQADWEWGLGDSHQMFVGASGLYNSDTNAIAAKGPGTRIKAYGTLDLRAGIRASNGRWEAMAWGRNVTNTYYWNNVGFNGDVLGRTTGLPATYGVTVTFKLINK